MIRLTECLYSFLFTPWIRDISTGYVREMRDWIVYDCKIE